MTHLSLGVSLAGLLVPETDLIGPVGPIGFVSLVERGIRC